MLTTQGLAEVLLPSLETSWRLVGGSSSGWGRLVLLHSSVTVSVKGGGIRSGGGRRTDGERKDGLPNQKGAMFDHPPPPPASPPELNRLEEVTCGA